MTVARAGYDNLAIEPKYQQTWPGSLAHAVGIGIDPARVGSARLTCNATPLDSRSRALIHNSGFLETDRSTLYQAQRSDCCSSCGYPGFVE